MIVLVNTICNGILVSCVSVCGINVLKKKKQKTPTTLSRDYIVSSVKIVNGLTTRGGI